MSASRVGCRPIVEDKWSLLAVTFLGDGPRRFTEVKRGLDGISQRMLTVTLRNLERDGVLSRTVHEVMPPNVSYALTPMGVSLLESIQPMLEWAAANSRSVEKARDEYDAEHHSGV
ncbi:winged helix-turn-helix transcriptional regulator [Cryptosporangium sp. NPDC051539]|uniref:winged helix-turn-helix transcriptional regulator n=1 Tax=Cryptosporangium sp. NPDC051539 TaxID=3363962 RepID=UPI0037ABAB74